MKKLIIAIALLAFLAPMTQAVARDANRDALREAWKVQQAKQKKERSVDQIGAPKFRSSINNPGTDSPDYYDSSLWEPIGN